MKAIRQNNTIISVVIVLLILCDLASLAVLFARLSAYSGTVFQNVIPLTESKGITKVTQTTRQEKYLSAGSFDEPQIVQLANPSFKAYDENTVWLSETNLEIFKLSYDGANGITVKGTDGDKLIAPGTSNEYVFTLENTGDVLLDYEMTIMAQITGTDLELPVKARVRDYTDKYLLGSESEKADVLELNSIDEKSKLSAGRFAVYTLEWQWPYERGNDEYDTMLGNLAADGDIALTIRINTAASYGKADVSADESSRTEPSESDNSASASDGSSPSTSGGDDSGKQYGLEGSTEAPKTGEAAVFVPIIIVVTFSLIVILFARPERRKDEADSK